MGLIYSDVFGRELSELRSYYIEHGRIPEARALFEALILLGKIPQVNPEDLRAKGKWIASKLGYLCCSKCHDAYIDPEWIAGGKWKYCPNCGARMETEE